MLSKTIKVKNEVYTLTLPMKKIEFLENLLDGSLIDVFNPVTDPATQQIKLPKISTLMKVIYVELQTHHPELTMDQVEKLMEDWLEEPDNNLFGLYRLAGQAANFFKEEPKKKIAAQ